MRTILPLIALLISSEAGAQELLINEIFADAAVDANCDGSVSSTGDEFVELVNLGPGALDLTGATISDSVGLKHTIGAVVLQPYEALVVFGGGVPALDGSALGLQPWCVDSSDWATVEVAGSLGLNNTGDSVVVADSTGTEIVSHAYGGEAGNDVSIVTDPELVGPNYIQHPTIACSPGTLIDGTGFVEPIIDTGVPTTPIDTGTATTDTEPTDTGTGTPGTPEMVRINEFLPDAAGADTGFEWVELVNTGSTPTDVSNWTIERATSGSYGSRFTFPPGSVIPAGGIVLVGEDYVPNVDFSLYGETFGFGNASSSGDALRLVQAGGRVEDIVIYGPDNSDGFEDDTGGIPAVGAPIPSAGASIGRLPSGTDTDDCEADFTLFPTPTPGAPNTGGVVTECDERADDVVINEFLANPAGTDTDFEWVELHNTGSRDLDISGWRIAAGTSSFTAGLGLPGGTTLVAGGFLVVGQTAIPEADVVAGGFSLGNASNADALRVEDCKGSPIDTIVYGDPNDDEDEPWLEDDGSLAVGAPSPGDGVTLGRAADGVDTDRSSIDIVALPFPTPGQSNTAEPTTCGGPESGIKINELMPNPAGGDEGQEWLELFHAGNEPVDLTGWSLQVGTSGFTSKHTFEEGTTLNPGDFLVFGGEYVPEADILVNLSLGNASSTSDAARFVDCNGFAADTVIYGTPNDDLFVDDDGEVATSTAPPAGDGEALQRVEDGYDTNQSGSDFALTLDASPGAPNPVVAPVVCVPTAGTITINEFLPDPDGTDEDNEWIELFNSSGSDVTIGGWQISAGTSNFEGIDITFGSDAVVPAGGFLVVGGADVEEADLIASFSLGNGTDTDGVRLFDCEGTAVDTALYGDEGNLDFLPDDLGVSAEPYADPGSNQSVARVGDGADTNTADDWIALGAPTPGQTNEREVGEIKDPLSGGCGCGQPSGTPSSDGPPPAAAASCNTSPLPFGGLELTAMLFAVARRRR